MTNTGAQLVRYALEQLNIQHIFAVVSPHNREIYHELNSSAIINTQLVSQELSAAFMADAISRTSHISEVSENSQSSEMAETGEAGQPNKIAAIGTMLITADAIISQGIAEAFATGVPLLIIAGSSDEPNPSLDSQQLIDPVTKACFKVTQHQEIVSTLFEAYQIATSGKPGPVYVDISMGLQWLSEDLDQPLPVHRAAANQAQLHADKIDNAIQLLLNAEHPALYLGWHATQVQPALIALAETIAAPVCTSLQGAGAFPAQHPLHAGLVATPSAQRSLKDCDTLLIVGANSNDIGETALLSTISHVIQIDSQAVTALLHQIQASEPADNLERRASLVKTIAKYKAQQKEDWLEHNSKGRVNPAVFFDALSSALDSNAIVVTGQGTHRALTAELLPLNNPHSFISPSNYNAKGYCVPAVTAIKLANPSKQVIGIVSDGAMVISGSEALTAVRNKLGTVYCLLNNSQPSTLKNLGHINWGTFADSLECGYFLITNNSGIDTILRRALETAAQGQPIIIDVCIDYGRKSYYAQSQEKAAQDRLPSRDKLEIVKRAIVRKIMGARAS